VQRRDFLKSVTAIATGLMAAAQSGRLVATPAPLPVEPPHREPINVALGVSTGETKRHLCDEQRAVLEFIKQCRAVSIEKEQPLCGAPKCRVVYRESDAKKTPLDQDADFIASVGAPVSITVTQTAGEFDTAYLDAFDSLHIEMAKPVYEVEITWIVPPEVRV